MPRCTGCDAYVMDGAPTCGECGRRVAMPIPAAEQTLAGLEDTTEARLVNQWSPPAARQVGTRSGFLGLSPQRTPSDPKASVISLTQELVHDALGDGSCIVCGRPPERHWWQGSHRSCDVCGLRTCRRCQEPTTRKEGFYLTFDWSDVWSCQGCGSEHRDHTSGSAG